MLEVGGLRAQHTKMANRMRTPESLQCNFMRRLNYSQQLNTTQGGRTHNTNTTDRWNQAWPSCRRTALRRRSHPPGHGHVLQASSSSGAPPAGDMAALRHLVALSQPVARAEQPPACG